jgi:hypothetical protein
MYVFVFEGLVIECIVSTFCTRNRMRFKLLLLKFGCLTVEGFDMKICWDQSCHALELLLMILTFLC